MPTWRLTFRPYVGIRRLVQDVDADELAAESDGAWLVCGAAKLS